VDAGQDERGRQVRPRLLSALSLASLGLLLVPTAPALAAGTTTGRLLVTLRAGAGRSPGPARTARAVVAAAGARRAGPSVPALRLVAVRPRAGASLHALAIRLRADPRVATVEVEHRGRPRHVPDDPALTLPETAAGTAPGTALEWWAARSRFPVAWDVTRGEGAVVAIVDTGADATHPDLAGRILAAASFGADGGGPGTDEVGHGTHVASLACGAGDNGVGLAGAGLRCGLLVAKSDFSDASVAAAIVWAVDHGADAVNMSFGTDPGVPASRAVRDAVAYAVAHDVVLVAAAADADVEDQGYPADLLQPAGSGPDVARGAGLSVTAADASDGRAPFAGHGTEISLAAYGAYGVQGGPPGIFGAFTAATNELEAGTALRPPCGCRASLAGDPRYGYLEGTSMAAPMVSAVAALVRHLNPDLPAARIVRLVKATALRPGGAWSPELGWGILDAGSALVHAAALDLRAPSSRVARLPARTARASVVVRWSGADAGPPGVRVSGVARYALYRSVDGGRARRLLTTRSTSARVRLRAGTRYGFFTEAVDAAGNRERAPRRADAHVARRAR
jgi:subtilisin family serine protease